MNKKIGLFANEDITRSDRSLHTPGLFAKQNLLYVQEVGRLESLKPHRCVREGLESFLFLIVLEGEGELVIGDKKFQIQRGDCAWIDCMRHYEHISDDDNAWKLAWVHFNGNAARGYYELFLKYNSGDNILKTGEPDSWNRMIGELLDKQREKSVLAELKSGELLIGLLNRILEKVAVDDIVEANDSKLRAEQVREYLNENYADREVLKKVFDEFDCPAEAMDESFEKHYGISLDEYITSRRLNAAKELLRFSIKPLEIVAEESGFADLVALQQIFKDKEGMSAEEYRMKWAQWIK